MATCDEIRRNIQAIEKNIAHIKKNLEDPRYTEQQKEDLRKDLEWQYERLQEAQNQLNDC